MRRANLGIVLRRVAAGPCSRAEVAADGKVNRKGMPNPLRLAVIAKHHFGDVRLPFPPAWLQRLGLAMGAPLGRLLGFKATYTPEAPSAPTALGV